MVLRSVPYHASVPRRLASASPPCSCGGARAFFWGGLAPTWRDGDLRRATSCSPNSSAPQHPHHLFSLVPEERPHCSRGVTPPSQHGDVPLGAISGLLCSCGGHPGIAVPLLSCACGWGGVTLPSWCRAGVRCGMGRDNVSRLRPPCPVEGPLATQQGWGSPEEVRMLPDVAQKMEIDGIFPEGQYL